MEEIYSRGAMAGRPAVRSMLSLQRLHLLSLIYSIHLLPTCSVWHEPTIDVRD